MHSSVAWQFGSRSRIASNLRTSPSNRNSTANSHDETFQSLISRIEKKLPGSGDEEGWHRYLKIDDLKSWSLSSNDVWEDGNELAINVLSRLRWERLNEDQRNFIDQPEFSELATYLSAWARQPVDYRQLLVDLELLEEDPINRVSILAR